MIKKGLESPVFVFGNRQCNWDPRCWECVQIEIDIYIYGEDYLTSVRAANLLKTGLAVNVSRTSHGRRNRGGVGGGGGTCATHLWSLFLYPLFKNISNPKMSTNPPVPFHPPPPSTSPPNLIESLSYAPALGTHYWEIKLISCIPYFRLYQTRKACFEHRPIC